MSLLERMQEESKGCIYHMNVDIDNLEQIEDFKKFADGRVVLTDEKTNKVFYDFRGRDGLLRELVMEIKIKTVREEKVYKLESLKYNICIENKVVKAVLENDFESLKEATKDYTDDWLRENTRKIKYMDIITK